MFFFYLNTDLYSNSKYKYLLETPKLYISYFSLNFIPYMYNTEYEYDMIFM